MGCQNAANKAIVYNIVDKLYTPEAKIIYNNADRRFEAFNL